jgi:hypothetical protein
MFWNLSSRPTRTPPPQALSRTHRKKPAALALESLEDRCLVAST